MFRHAWQVHGRGITEAELQLAFRAAETRDLFCSALLYRLQSIAATNSASDSEWTSFAESLGLATSQRVRRMALLLSTRLASPHCIVESLAVFQAGIPGLPQSVLSFRPTIAISLPLEDPDQEGSKAGLRRRRLSHTSPQALAASVLLATNTTLCLPAPEGGSKLNVEAFSAAVSDAFAASQPEHFLASGSIPVCGRPDNPNVTHVVWCAFGESVLSVQHGSAPRVAVTIDEAWSAVDAELDPAGDDHSSHDTSHTSDATSAALLWGLFVPATVALLAAAYCFVKPRKPAGVAVSQPDGRAKPGAHGSAKPMKRAPIDGMFSPGDCESASSPRVQFNGMAGVGVVPFCVKDPPSFAAMPVMFEIPSGSFDMGGHTPTFTTELSGDFTQPAPRLGHLGPCGGGADAGTLCDYPVPGQVLDDMRQRGLTLSGRDGTSLDLPMRGAGSDGASGASTSSSGRERMLGALDRNGTVSLNSSSTTSLGGISQRPAQAHDGAASSAALSLARTRQSGPLSGGTNALPVPMSLRPPFA